MQPLIPINLTQIKHNLIKRKIKETTSESHTVQSNETSQSDNGTTAQSEPTSQSIQEQQQTTQRPSTVQTTQPKQVNHQLRHNHNIVQKVTHQNNPHLKAQKTNHLQSKHQLNNLQQKKTFIATKYEVFY